MAETLPVDISNMKGAEPTATLRWNGPVLEQLYHLQKPNEKGERFEWHPVPNKEDYSWGET